MSYISFALSKVNISPLAIIGIGEDIFTASAILAGPLGIVK